MKKIVPQDSSYESAKKTFGSHGNPEIILYPESTDEVVQAIQVAKEHKGILSIRSGGHSVSGFASNTGGVVIDLSELHSVELIDTGKHVVRIGAGARWGEVAKILQEKNLGISSGDTKSVGVGGLTLGGGIGWMVRKYGLTIDSLIAAEIVTADGKIHKVSKTENPDLFWAIRGGGGNFGIVTYFEFTAHPVGSVYGGMIMYTPDNLDQLLKGWRDFMRTADENLTTSLMIMPAFMGNPPGVMIMVCYANDNEPEAMQITESLKKLGTVTSQNITKKAYADMLEEAHPPEGIKVLVNNVFIESLNDEVIETVVETHRSTPSLFLQMRSLGGVLRQAVNLDSAFAFHQCEAMFMAPVFVPPTATQQEINQALLPWQKIAAFGRGAYSGFLSQASEKEVSMIYPQSTYQRLVKIKAQYDPQNLFAQNFNIKP